MEEKSYVQRGRCLGLHKFSQMLEGLLGSCSHETTCQVMGTEYPDGYLDIRWTDIIKGFSFCQLL